jgi:hypothetical protein
MYVHENIAEIKRSQSRRKLEKYYLKLTDKCSNELDINKKINLLYKINSVLPGPNQVNIPSLITDDYIDTALYRIHKNIQASSTAAV